MSILEILGYILILTIALVLGAGALVSLIKLVISEYKLHRNTNFSK